MSGNCRYYVDYYNTDPKFKFQVDESTGYVSIRNELDADVPRTFSLHILAVDQGKMSSYHSLFVGLVTIKTFLIVNFLKTND